MKIYCLLMGLFFSWSVYAGDVYSAPDPEPTSEETVILELMNRMRADPKSEGVLIASLVKEWQNSWVTRGVDMEMFVKEMSEIKKSPPLVFNLHLLESARKHSYYMIHNGLTHVEQPGLKGFVAEQFSERMKAAGYSGNSGGENCYVNAPDPLGSHVGFVIDTGPGGTGGMQLGRGHRTNMNNLGYREVGSSGVANGKGLSVTHNFGNRNVPRLCGGVIYVDKNGNQFYDVGEGLGGVKVSASDGSSVQTWKSGAFAIDLKNAGVVTMTAEYAGQTCSKTFEAGSENIKFDWIVPEKASLDLAEKLIQKVEAITDKKSSNYFNAVVELYMECGSLGVDAPRRSKIDEFTKEVGPKLSAAQKAVRDALSNFNPQTFQTVVNDQKKAFTGSKAKDWFIEAGTAGMVKMGTANFLKCVAADKQYLLSNKKPFVEQLEATQKSLKISEFISIVTEALSQVHALDSSAKKSKR